MNSIPVISFTNFLKQNSLNPNLMNINIEVIEKSIIGGNITDLETIIICYICKLFNPNKILELGTFNGRTTVNIANNTNTNAEIITVDIPKNKSKNTKYALEGVNPTDCWDETGYAGFENKVYNNYPKLARKIEQLWIDSADIDFIKYKNYFDLIFVDASHSYENCKNDSVNSFKMIKDNGIILWHDYGLNGNGWPGVNNALNEIYSKIETLNEFFKIKTANMYLIENTSLVIFKN